MLEGRCCFYGTLYCCDIVGVPLLEGRCCFYGTLYCCDIVGVALLEGRCCFYGTLYCCDIVGMALLEGRCCFYGNREKVKDLLQLCHVKALVTSHEAEDWESHLSTVTQVRLLTYLLHKHIYCQC